MNSGIQCPFCTSFNTFFFSNPLHIRNCIICGYCYAITNLSFEANDENYKLDSKHLEHLNEFAKKIIDKNNYKDVLVFDNYLSKEHIDLGQNININFIKNYESIKNPNKLLKYSGLLKFIIVPNLNLFNLFSFYTMIKDLLAPNFTLTVGILRENYYTGKPNKNYHHIYNGFCIEKILQKTPDFVQSDFSYKDNFLIINIARYEPSFFEIKELDTLVNDFILEDSDPKNIKNF